MYELKEEEETNLGSGSVMDRYQDVPDGDVVAERGRPPDRFLRSLTRATYILKDKTPRKVKFRCVMAPEGCTANWANRARDRVLKHAAKCKRLSPELRQKANAELDSESLRTQLANQKTSGKAALLSAGSELPTPNQAGSSRTSGSALSQSAPQKVRVIPLVY